MTAPLDPKTKKLRGMTPAQLADSAGTKKAIIADATDELEDLKQELVRRGISDASGALFDATLTPPGPRDTLDKAALVADFGEAYVKERYTKTTIGTSYTLRVTARKQAAARLAAA